MNSSIPTKHYHVSGGVTQKIRKQTAYLLSADTLFFTEAESNGRENFGLNIFRQWLMNPEYQKDNVYVTKFVTTTFPILPSKLDDREKVKILNNLMRRIETRKEMYTDLNFLANVVHLKDTAKLMMKNNLVLRMCRLFHQTNDQITKYQIMLFLRNFTFFEDHAKWLPKNEEIMKLVVSVATVNLREKSRNSRNSIIVQVYGTKQTVYALYAIFNMFTAEKGMFKFRYLEKLIKKNEKKKKKVKKFDFESYLWNTLDVCIDKFRGRYEYDNTKLYYQMFMSLNDRLARFAGHYVTPKCIRRSVEVFMFLKREIFSNSPQIQRRDCENYGIFNNIFEFMSILTSEWGSGTMFYKNAKNVLTFCLEIMETVHKTKKMMVHNGFYRFALEVVSEFSLRAPENVKKLVFRRLVNAADGCMKEVRANFFRDPRCKNLIMRFLLGFCTSKDSTIRFHERFSQSFFEMVRFMFKEFYQGKPFTDYQEVAAYRHLACIMKSICVECKQSFFEELDFEKWLLKRIVEVIMDNPPRVKSELCKIVHHVFADFGCVKLREFDTRNGKIISSQLLPNLKGAEIKTLSEWTKEKIVKGINNVVDVIQNVIIDGKDVEIKHIGLEYLSALKGISERGGGEKEREQYYKEHIKTCKHCMKQPAKNRCSKCKTVYYCNRKCQVADWKKHKRECVKK